MKNNKHIQSFAKFNENLDNDNEKMTMIFGDNNTIFKKFNDEDSEDSDYLLKNNGKVKLSCVGFAEEWENFINYNKSFAYIDNGKLYVIVYGLPKNINKNSVKNFFEKTLEYYLNKGYGEFFETEPGCPICMIVELNNKEVIV